MVLIRTNDIGGTNLFDTKFRPENMHIVDSADLMIQNLVS